MEYEKEVEQEMFDKILDNEYNCAPEDLSFKSKKNRVYQYFDNFLKTQQAKNLGLVKENQMQHISSLLERSHQFSLIEQFENIEKPMALLKQKIKEYTDYINQINNKVYLKIGSIFGVSLIIFVFSLEMSDMLHSLFLFMFVCFASLFFGITVGGMIGEGLYQIKKWFKKRNKTSQKIKSDIQILETEIASLKKSIFQALNDKTCQHEIMAIIQRSRKLIESTLERTAFEGHHLSQIEDPLQKAFIKKNQEKAFNQIREYYVTIHNLDRYYKTYVHEIQSIYDSNQKQRDFEKEHNAYLNQIKNPELKNPVDYKIKGLL